METTQLLPVASHHISSSYHHPSLMSHSTGSHICITVTSCIFHVCRCGELHPAVREDRPFPLRREHDGAGGPGRPEAEDPIAAEGTRPSRSLGGYKPAGLCSCLFHQEHLRDPHMRITGTNCESCQRFHQNVKKMFDWFQD